MLLQNEDQLKIFLSKLLNNTFSASVFLALMFLPVVTGCHSSSVYTKLPINKDQISECVILIHGLGRTYRSMKSMESQLRKSGYTTVNLDYPSRKKTIEQIASEDLLLAIMQCDIGHSEKMHFVTHSMGGIVLRQALKTNQHAKLGHVVMLSPPNKGSYAVDAIKDRWYYKWINGPAGQQLTTDPNSLPNSLGPANFSVGIISGNDPAFFDTWISKLIPGIDDGKVGIENTKLDGMKDFLIVPESHTYIMKSTLVHKQVIHFLKNGTFDHENS